MNILCCRCPVCHPLPASRSWSIFDGGLLSSDGGVWRRAEVEQRLRFADRLAACIIAPRAADQITHSSTDVIVFDRR